ncbi:MAG: aldehyde dehydrogenase family protein, partial [Moorea sp. SIO4G2]|nr:aldehyde dehydrogenase family protein [Moorena sp. SIO4G2]
MAPDYLPSQVLNWIDGQQVAAVTGEWFDKLDPTNGQVLCQVARSRAADIEQAVRSAKQAQP